MANSMFEFGGWAIGHDMECGEVVALVNTPSMEVMDILDVGQSEELLFNVGERKVGGSFFEEDCEGGSEVFNGMDDNKDGHADGEYRIDIGNVDEFHDDGSDEDYYPAKDILKHVKVDRFLVQGFTTASKVGGEEVDDSPNDGQNDHSVVVDGCWMKETEDSIDDDEAGSEEKN